MDCNPPHREHTAAPLTHVPLPGARPTHSHPQEFQPWIKWLVFDALLTLLLGLVVKRFEGLRPLFEAVGWL